MLRIFYDDIWGPELLFDFDMFRSNLYVHLWNYIRSLITDLWQGSICLSIRWMQAILITDWKRSMGGVVVQERQYMISDFTAGMRVEGDGD
jgi:hypothetical protein